MNGTEIAFIVLGWIISGVYANKCWEKRTGVDADWITKIIGVLFAPAVIGAFIGEIMNDKYGYIYRNKINKKFQLNHSLIKLDYNDILIKDDRFAWDGKGLLYGVLFGNTEKYKTINNEEFYFFWNGEHKDNKRVMLVYDLELEVKKRWPESKYLERWNDGEKFVNSIRIIPVCYWLH